MVRYLAISILARLAVAVFVLAAVQCSADAQVESSLVIAMAVSAYATFIAIVRLFLVRSGSQMIRISASAITALMVNLKASRQVAFEENPCCLVCSNDFSFKSDLPVAFLVNARRPVPASGLGVELELVGESFDEGFEWHKEAADPETLNRPHELATLLNRLLNQMFSRYFEAVQSLPGLWGVYAERQAIS